MQSNLSMSRRRRLPMLLTAGLSAWVMMIILGTGIANAADITVNTGGDEFGAGPTTCSLREAIQSANTDSNFGGCVGSGPYGDDRIIFAPDVPVVTLSITTVGADNDDNSFLDLDINDLSFPNNLTISGPPGKVTVQTAPGWNDRVFDLPAGSSPQAAIVIENLVIRGGGVDFTTTPETGVACGYSGGGVRGIGSLRSLTLRNVVVQDNQVTGGNGGGLCEGFNGVFELDSSEVLSNSATAATMGGGQAGGLWLNGGPAPRTIQKSTIAYNRAQLEGGGVVNQTIRGLTMTESKVFSNTAGYLQTNTGMGGGGIWSFSGLTLDRTDVVSNTAFYNPMMPFIGMPGGGGIHHASSATGPLTIVEGQISFNRVHAISAGAQVAGGGVLNGGPSSTFMKVRIEANVVDQAAASTSANGHGGGVFNPSRLTISGSQVIQNRVLTTNGRGGGVANLSMMGPPSAQIDLVGVTVADNEVVSADAGVVSGGGISNLSPNDIATIDNSVIESNRVSAGAGGQAFGGGIESAGKTTVTKSSILSNNGGAQGGGVHNTGVFQSINSTLSGNLSNAGGGLYNLTGSSYLTHTTIANTVSGGGLNVAGGAVQVLGALLANNTGANCTGAVTHNGVSLSSDSTCTGFALTNVNPLLQPLATNGGLTPNHALSPGSPAIDQAGVCSLPDDQRGVPRPQGLACDIGAFELEEANLVVTKTAMPASAMGGETITYTVLVVNSSNVGFANNIVLTDTLSGGATFGGVVSAGGFTLQSSSGSQAVFTLPSLAGSSGTTLVFTATAPMFSSTVVNTVTVTSGNPDPNPSNNSSSVTTPVTAPTADLDVMKAATPSPVLAGETITYTLSVTNAGPDLATNVVLTDVMQGGAVFGGAVSLGGFTLDSNTSTAVTFTLASLAVGNSATVVFTATAPTSGVVVNEAGATADQGDPNQVNNFASVNTTVTEVANLQIGKLQDYTAILTDTVAPGGTITYTLLVTNSGPSNAANVIVTDTVPTGVSLTSASGSGWTCTLNAPTVTCTAAALSAGPASAITIVATAPITGGLTLTNTAEVSSTTLPSTPVLSNAVTVKVGYLLYLPLIRKEP